MRKHERITIATVRQSKPKMEMKGETGSATTVKIASGPSTGSLTGQRCFR
jgi:hypothetical protein